MTGRGARRVPARARLAVLAGLALLAIGGAAVVASRDTTEPAKSHAVAEKPELLLLTGLPILFGERFGLGAVGSPALAELEQHFRVRPIDVANSASLGSGRLLLMAQPRAQPAEALVELDGWVRSGGRLVLLADPLLEWPSERPLGDVLRPATAFADTGLLKHWGLTLYSPDDRGPKQLSIGRHAVLASSPGTLEGRCEIAPDRLVARCRVGKGQATVIADADFLNVEDLDGPTADNLTALVAELSGLAKP